MSTKMGDPETGDAAREAAPVAANASLLHEARKFRRFRGSLYRFMYDEGTKNTHEGYSIGLEEIGIPLVQAVLCELFGMFIYQLAFIGVNTASSSAFYLALGQGTLYFMMLLSLGSLSGAHLNPVITIGTMATGMTSVLRGVLYLTAQIIGAVLAESLFLDATTKYEAANIGVCGYLNTLENMNNGYLLVFNFVLMYMLQLMVFKVALDARTSSLFGPLQTSLLTGVAYFVLAYVCAGFSTFNIYIIPNPAICTASYNAFTSTSLTELNNGAGASMSWLGAFMATGFYVLTHYGATPQHTVTATEEESRNTNRLRVD